MPPLPPPPHLAVFAAAAGGQRHPHRLLHVLQGAAIGGGCVLGLQATALCMALVGKPFKARMPHAAPPPPTPAPCPAPCPLPAPQLWVHAVLMAFVMVTLSALILTPRAPPPPRRCPVRAGACLRPAAWPALGCRHTPCAAACLTAALPTHPARPPAACSHPVCAGVCQPRVHMGPRRAVCRHDLLHRRPGRQRHPQAGCGGVVLGGPLGRCAAGLRSRAPACCTSLLQPAGRQRHAHYGSALPVCLPPSRQAAAPRSWWC